MGVVASQGVRVETVPRFVSLRSHWPIEMFGNYCLESWAFLGIELRCLETTLEEYWTSGNYCLESWAFGNRIGARLLERKMILETRKECQTLLVGVMGFWKQERINNCTVLSPVADIRKVGFTH